MSVWQWVADYRDEAYENDDEDRLRLSTLYQEALDLKDSDPAGALAILRQGRRLAEELAEPRWVLFYDHWMLQIRLFFAHDYHNILDQAVKATLEAAKPQFADLPQRVCLHEDLIYAHVNIDPHGYAAEIEKALDYMSGQVGPKVECRHCLQECRTAFELARDRLDVAQASAARQLDMADQENSDHYGSAALSNLCQLSARRGDYGPLGEFAAEGEQLARNAERPKVIAEFQMWQAVSLRAEGDEEGAQQHYRHAQARIKRVDAPSDEYHDALCQFHEVGGDLDRALKVRDRQLADIQGQGRWATEFRVHMLRCQLLQRLNQLRDEDIQAARAAAAPMRNPQPYLEALEQTLKR